MSALQSAVWGWRNRTEVRRMLHNYRFFAQGADLSLWGSVSDRNARELGRLLGLAGDSGPIIEIGTLFGFTTQLIASQKQQNQVVITVDNYSWNPFGLSPDDHRAFTQRALQYCLSKSLVETVDDTSESFFASYDRETPALVFLDGSHDYEHVRNEIRHAKRLGARVICGDDYHEMHAGVVRAVKEEFGKDFSVEHTLWSHVTD